MDEETKPSVEKIDCAEESLDVGAFYEAKDDSFDLIEKVQMVYARIDASHGVYDSDLDRLRWELPHCRELIVLAKQVDGPEVQP